MKFKKQFHTHFSNNFVSNFSGNCGSASLLFKSTAGSDSPVDNNFKKYSLASEKNANKFLTAISLNFVKIRSKSID